MSHAQNVKSLGPKVKVLERKKIWEGGVVRLKVPVSAQLTRYDDGKIQIPYLYFHHSVVGGRVHMHVLLQGNEELRGKTITARVAVYEKKVEGGRNSMYVDFTAVSDNERITHRFFVASYGALLEMPAEDGWVRFDLPEPLDGVIAFGKPDATMPASKRRRGLIAADVWIGGVPDIYAGSNVSVTKEQATADQVSSLAAKFKVSKMR